MHPGRHLAVFFLVAACAPVEPEPGPEPSTDSLAARKAAVEALIEKVEPLQVGPEHPPTEVGAPQTATETREGVSFTCTTRRFSAAENVDHLVAMNPNADVLWPGSVVQGASIASGSLDPVPSKRGPGSLVLTIASGGKDSFSAAMAEPNLGSATNAMNQVLFRYQNATPSKFQFEVQNAYSLDQVLFSLGGSAKWATQNVKATLSFSTEKEYRRVAVKLTQEYFTMAFVPPASASDFFAPSVTAEELAPYTGVGNPLTYVGAVTYGRIFVFLFESEADQSALAAAVSATFRAGTVDAGAQLDAGYKDIVNRSRVKVFAIGGNAADAMSGATGNVDQVLAFLKKGANFGPDQPGAPISYSLRYVKNSQAVRVNLATAYAVKDCAPVGLSTQDLLLKASRLFCKSSCDGWSCGQYYWTWTADLLDPAGAVARSWTWSARGRDQAARACSGFAVSAPLGEEILRGVPKQKGVCLLVKGSLYEADSPPNDPDDFVGDFRQLHCFDGQGFPPPVNRSVELSSGTCGEGAVLDYSLAPLGN